jgi:hypothetical protein
VSVITGLRWVFEAARQGFVDQLSTLVQSWSGTGTSQASFVSTSTGYGTGRAVLVRFPAGGTVGGTAGANPGDPRVYTITYQVSTDGGTTWTTAAALNAALTVAITWDAGVLTLSLTTAGTIPNAGLLTWTPQPIAFDFGELQPQVQLNQGAGGGNRIVFAPGDKDGGLGELVEVRGPGAEETDPDATLRSLADIKELFRVLVWGYDTTARAQAADALAQYEATRLLYDHLIRILRNSFGTFGPEKALCVKSQKWLPVTTRPKGREIEMTWTVRCPIPDDATELGFPTAAYDEALTVPTGDP